MTEDEWSESENPFQMLCYLKSRPGKARLRTHFGRGPALRKLRLFLVSCCRRVAQYLSDERSINAIEVAERFADGFATFKELERAHGNARKAYSAVREKKAATEYCAAAVAYEAARSDLNWTNAIESCIYGADVATMVPVAAAQGDDFAIKHREERHQAELLRDVLGNCPSLMRPTMDAPSQTVVDVAKTIYEGTTFEGMPILADALEESGCCEELVLTHCRSGQQHIKGCWVLDLILR